MSSLFKVNPWPWRVCVTVVMATTTLLIGSELMTNISIQKDVVPFKIIRLETSFNKMLSQTLQNDSRYIIYTCDGKYKLCGGWSDRISGMLTSFLISKLLGYKFGVLLTKPCDINLFFSPNTINWTFNKATVSKMDKSDHYLIDSRSFRDSLPKMKLTDTFNKNVNYVRMNWDYRVQIMNRKNVQSDLPWLFNTREADIYRIFYLSMFTPKGTLATRYKKFRDRLDPFKTIICAHIRTGENFFFPVNKIGIVWNFLKQFKNTSNTYIYIATNNDKIKSEGKSIFPEHFIDIDGPLTHNDKSDSCQGNEKTLLEFTLLTECDTIILTSSGFGITAAYVRRDANNIYCLTAKSGVVTCSKYNLESHLGNHLRAPLHKMVENN